MALLETHESLGEKKMQWEILGAFVKPKILSLVLSTTVVTLIGGCVTAGFAGLTIYGLQLSTQRPTIPEIEEHIDNDDRRIDDISKTIDKRFDQQDEDRKERKRDSDARYKDLSDSIHSLQQYQSYVSGGGAIIGFLLTIGVIKLNSTEKKISDQRARVPGALKEEDIEQLVVMARYLQNKEPRRR